MRHGKGFEHQTTALRQHFKLVEQARLTQPRLAHHADDLALTLLRLLQYLLHLLQLGVTTDEAGESTAGGHLQSCSEWSSTEDLVHFKWFFHPFDGGCA